MSTLNEKIYKAMLGKNHIHVQKGDEMKMTFTPSIAANEIEKLILQHEIDLLNDCISADEHLTEINVSLKISELTNQLNKL